MFFRSLLARSGSLRLSVTPTTRTCSRSLSTLRLAYPARCTAPACMTLRWSSTAPAIRADDQDNTRTSPPPSGTCFIANIPYKVTAEQLKGAFSEFGKIVSVTMLTSDEGVPRGAGFVHFESVEDARNFVEANRADPVFVLDRQLFVNHAQRPMKNMREPAGPCDTLLVHNFQGDSEAGVRAMFGVHAEQILAVRFDKKETGQPFRKAFVQFCDVDMATEAMDGFRKLNDTEIGYARQRQPPANAYNLTSRLSRHRNSSDQT